MTVKKTPALEAASQVDAAVAAGKETVEAVVKAGTEVATKSYEKAVAMTRESVDNAAKAQADAVKGYEDVVAFNRENVEALVKSSNILFKGFQDLGKEVVGLAHGTLEDSVANTKALFGCKNLKEVTDLQASLARVSYDTFAAESRRLTELSVKMVEQAFLPISARMNATIEVMNRPVAL